MEKLARTSASSGTPLGHVTLILHIIAVPQESPEVMLLVWAFNKGRDVSVAFDFKFFG